MTAEQYKKNTPSNWKFLCVILVASVAVTFAVNLMVSTADLSQAQSETEGAPPSAVTDAFNRTVGSLYGVVALTNFLMVGSAGLLLAHMVRKFIFPNTLGRHTGKPFNDGWLEMQLKERTRWVLALIIIVVFAALTGRSRGAETALPVSDKAKETIIYYEVGGREYYESRLTRPEVPAWRTTSSGVTVCFGVDLGQMTRDQIAETFDGIAAPHVIRALQSVSGMKGSNAYYNGLPRVRDLEFSWQQAEQVFEKRTLPRFTRLTAQTFHLTPNRLSGHENGALTSLVFNRGGSKTGASRLEMRKIDEDIAAGYAGRVPGHLRAMKRLWSPVTLRGLHLRRDAEARLFYEGLMQRVSASR